MHLLARDLSIQLGGRQVIDRVSWTVATGKWVGLLGPNGSGKTTLLRTVAGLLPYSGQLELDGNATASWDLRELARALAFVRQSTNVAFDFRVADFVLLGRVPYGSALTGYTNEDVERLEAILVETDLTHLRHRSILHLSGGELQRVVLAQALLQEPSVLLLDEPTTHLDVEHQFTLLQTVANRVKNTGLTVVSSFHDLELASRFADELLVLKDGRVAGAGRPTDVVTPEMIRSVFRMKSETETIDNGSLRINYLELEDRGQQ